MSRIRTAFQLLRATSRTIRSNQVTFLAAAIAYYGFVSLVPLAFLTVSIAGFIDTAWFEPVLARSDQFLTPQAIDLITRSLGNTTATGGATVIGLAVLLWSGSRVFRGLDVAFSQVYGTEKHKPLSAQVLDVVIVLGGIPAAVGAAAILGVLLPFFTWVPGSGLASRFALVLVLVVVFFPMYYRFPDADVTVRDALPGTLFAAVGWGVLATGFSVYASHLGTVHLYGILGAALLLVTWLYLGGIIIMVGAVVNTVMVGRPSDDGDQTPGDESGQPASEPAPDVAALGQEVNALREELDEKTVSRSSLESELKAYVRKRQREGKASGWGPYLVLLYGTVMTLGAFYWLQGGWAILAMIVVWLSTLGLYVQLVIFGLGLQAASVPGRLVDTLRQFRS